MYLERLSYYLDTEDGRADFGLKVLDRLKEYDTRIEAISKFYKDISFSDENSDREYRMNVISEVARMVFRSSGISHLVGRLSISDENLVFNDYECLSSHLASIKPQITKIYRRFMTELFGEEYEQDCKEYVCRKAEMQAYYDAQDEIKSSFDD